MKQFILYHQVDKELSEKAKKKLRSWAVKNKYQNQLYAANYSPTIGQMIHFLGENYWKTLTIFPRDGEVIIMPESNLGWDISQICDILWKAVKEVLEK